MPLKVENPITSYFPRVSPDAKIKTPVQSKPRLAKRARSPHEIDPSTEGSTRKKSKSRKQPDARNYENPRSPPSTAQSGSVQVTFTRKAKGEVIEIQETPPSTPLKAGLFRQSIPPSSPLPDLTPSPELSPHASTPLHPFSFDDLADSDEPNPSRGARAYPEPLEDKLDLIPSSQTQAIGFYSDEEDNLKNVPKTASPSSTLSNRSSEHDTHSQISSYIPSFQPDATSPDFFNPSDKFIPSSQSQLMDPVPTSPITPDFETVPSSQSQELSYSQAPYHSPKKIETMSRLRTSLMDIYIDQPTPTRSWPDGENTESCATPENPSEVTEEPYHSPAIPSSQTPACTSRPSSPCHEAEELPSTQPTNNCWNDREGSYESLPDAVEKFRSMFGESFESLPPDFPMSLRF
ncbi:hypothetical protein D9756_000788 [Leucocoprinus leucothites]|uniref:Uncharacterized protein n=1 Tax=Leucocoprinus leucothites TaxID=201217 RepID=A0A8H5LNN2_9AGAR|nr:hypothetical protein D9756_000788 [Leucoagaricus leucothites]